MNNLRAPRAHNSLSYRHLHSEDNSCFTLYLYLAGFTCHYAARLNFSVSRFNWNAAIQSLHKMTSAIKVDSQHVFLFLKRQGLIVVKPEGFLFRGGNHSSYPPCKKLKEYLSFRLYCFLSFIVLLGGSGFFRALGFGASILNGFIFMVSFNLSMRLLRPIPQGQRHPRLCAEWLFAILLG